MTTSAPTHPLGDASPPPSSKGSQGETGGTRDTAAPPRVREKAARGERNPQASWRQRLSSVGSLLKETAAQWSDDEAARLAASLALYTLLSIAPLLVISIAVAGMVFGEEAARGQISNQLATIVGPQAEGNRSRAWSRTLVRRARGSSARW